MDMKLHLDTGKILTIKLVDHHLIREWANLFCSLPLEETEISKLFDSKLHIDNNTVEEILNSEDWKNFFNILKNDSSKVPFKCRSNCTNDLNDNPEETKINI